MTKIFVTLALIAMVGVSACGVKGPLDAPSPGAFVVDIDRNTPANAF